MTTLLKRSVVGFVAAALLAAFALFGTSAFTTQDAYADTAPTPLTFTAEQTNSTISLSWRSGSDVKYRVSSTSVLYNGSAAPATAVSGWETYAKGTTITLSTVDDWVSFKGTNVSTDVSEHFIMAGKIAGSGDVTSLCDGIGGDVKVPDFGWNCMFLNCDALTTAPNLPSTTLDYTCYSSMFKGCTSLTTAPALPAINLAGQCYYSMFEGCTSLLNAPELPATQLAMSCYTNMFSGCTALVAPADMTNVTTIGIDYGSMPGSCEGMYSGCTNLKVYSQPQTDYARPWKATSATVDDTNYPNWSLNMFAGTGATGSDAVTGAVVAGTTYYIAGNVPTASNFDFTAPTNLTVDGTAKAATVAPKSGVTGMGEVTVYYSADNGTTWSTTAPTEAGTYLVKIDVAAGTGWAAATDVTDSTWTFDLVYVPTPAPSPTPDSDPTSAEESVPDTSDMTPTVPALALAVAALAAIAIARKRLA